MTSTIEVANGMNASGSADRAERNSIAAIATAPPTAPATMPIHGRPFILAVPRFTSFRVVEERARTILTGCVTQVESGRRGRGGKIVGKIDARFCAVGLGFAHPSNYQWHAD
jgi:hypothetical protein